MRVVIEAISGPGQGQRFLINKNQVVIVGRTEWSDVAIPNDSQISGKHFSIENSGRDVRLSDLESTNGTMLNDEFVKQATLKSGDQIVAGSTCFRVKIEQAGDGGHETPQFSGGSGSPIAGNGGGPPNAPPPPGRPQSAPSAPSTNPNSPVFSSPIFVPSDDPGSQGKPTDTPSYAAPAAKSGAPSPPPPPPPAAESPAPPPPTGPSQQRQYSTPFGDIDESPPPPTPSAASGAGAAVPESVSPVAPTPPSAQHQPPQSDQPPEREVVLDVQRRAVEQQSGNSMMFEKTELENGAVALESFPPADPENAGAAATAIQLAQVGQWVLITHHSKAEMPLPEDLAGTPLFHWLPEEVAREYGPLIVSPQPKNAHLGLLDELWTKDSVIGFVGPDGDKIKEYLKRLVRFNPAGAPLRNSMFGFCWPSVLGSILKSGQANVVDAVLDPVITLIFCESSEQPGAWCVFGRPGIESTMQQLGFQEIAAQPAEEPAEEPA